MFLTTFDEALVKDCYRREQSIVPQQALALSNSGLVLEASAQIANRLAVESDHEFIRKAFRVLLGIDASENEVQESDLAFGAWRALPNATSESARANFVWTLINHNDFVTLR
jgi:Arc/MetJ family transcription regulator